MTDVLAPLHMIIDQHGLVLRREARELGFDDTVLRQGVRRGALVRVRHGAYVDANGWESASEEDRHRLLTRAVLRTNGDRVAASHHSAALLHGMDLWGVDLSRAHVTRLDGSAGRTERDVVHHEGLAVADDIHIHDGLALMRPARAALESAMLGGVERGLVVADSGLRLGLFDEADLAAEVERMRFWPRSQPLHLVSRLASAQSESAGESRTFFVMWSAGIPMPERQFAVHDGEVLVGICDFAWPEHGLLGEFDGRVKYGRYLREGEDPGDAVFREKKREDWLREVTGWRVIRFTWADLAEPRRMAARLRAALRVAA